MLVDMNIFRIFAEKFISSEEMNEKQHHFVYIFFNI